MSDKEESDSEDGEVEEGEEEGEGEEEEGEVADGGEEEEEEEEEGEVGSGGLTRSRVIRHPSVKPEDPLPATLPLCPEIRTLTGVVEFACKKFDSKPLYTWRPPIREHVVRDFATKKELVTVEYGDKQTLTYAQFWEMVKATSTGLLRYEPTLLKGSFVGLYLNTCKEWTISMHAAMLAGCTCVTVYANLGFDALVKVINETKMGMIVCEADNVLKMDEELAGKCPSLKKLIVVGPINYKSKHFEMRSLHSVMLEGRENMLSEFPNRPQPDDRAVIMYTSGTTGDPKGVMINQSNLVASARGILDRIGFKPSDVYLSYLPLAHVFELVVHNMILSTGCLICFGNPRTLAMKPGGAHKLGDLEAYKPTVFIGVPKVFETVCKGIRRKVTGRSKVAQALFNSVLNRKVAALKKFGRRNKNVFGAKKIFSKVRKALGGKTRIVCSGGAPLSSDAHAFLQAVLGKHTAVIQGYALTESTCGGFVQDPSKMEYIPLCVGEPFTCVECVLESVPEMKYNAKAKGKKLPHGEILLRGPCISQGYYKKLDATAEVFDEDGWFHTGDIGRLNTDDTISIVDRKKHLVKLSGGEYCALEQLEMLYGTSPFVAPNGVCLHADSFKEHLVGIVLPDLGYAEDWASQFKKFKGMTPEDIMEDPTYKAAVLESFERIHREDSRKPHERLPKVAIFNDEWTPENDMLTASNKLKRRNIAVRYAEAIEKMYSGETAGAGAVVPAVPDDGVPKFYHQVKPAFEI